VPATMLSRCGAKAIVARYMGSIRKIRKIVIAKDPTAVFIVAGAIVSHLLTPCQFSGYCFKDADDRIGNRCTGAS
jgi:hypothetical protein